VIVFEIEEPSSRPSDNSLIFFRSERGNLLNLPHTSEIRDATSDPRLVDLKMRALIPKNIKAILTKMAAVKNLYIYFYSLHIIRV